MQGLGEEACEFYWRKGLGSLELMIQKNKGKKSCKYSWELGVGRRGKKSGRSVLIQSLLPFFFHFFMFVFPFLLFSFFGQDKLRFCFVLYFSFFACNEKYGLSGQPRPCKKGVKKLEN